MEENIHLPIGASASFPLNSYDHEERSLLFNSSWQSECPEVDQPHRANQMLIQLQKQCATGEEEDEEEEEEKEEEEERQSLNFVKHVGKAAKLKRFFHLLKQSMKRQQLPTPTNKEQQLAPAVSSVTTGHNPEHLYRLIAQRQINAEATRPPSLYSQADSAYGSRSSSQSNSIRRRSTAAVSTLTSNCPSHYEYGRQDSFISTREGTFTLRQGSVTKLRFPLGKEQKASDKQAREREDCTPLYENIQRQSPPVRKHTECHDPTHATAPNTTNETQGVETLVISPLPADYEDDDSDLPEQRLMMMTAGCARASRRKPQFLVYTKRGRSNRSRNKYSPVNTNPLTCSGTVLAEETQTAASSDKEGMAYQPPHTDQEEVHPLPLTRQLSYREGCMSGEFNKIIHHLHAIHSSLCQALDEDSISFNDESSDHEGQELDYSETPPPPLPLQEAEMYLQAAVILQKALSTLSLDLEEMIISGESEDVLQEVQ